MPQEDALVNAVVTVAKELRKAMSKHPPMHSLHEASAVIREEFEEFWDIVKLKEELRDPAKTREELVQLAAMAIRALVDLNLVNSNATRINPVH